DLDADDAALLVEPDAVAYGVLHDGLQEQGRDGEGGALRRDVELDVERLAEPRVLDLEVRARVLHLALHRRVLGMVEDVAIEIGHARDEVTRALRVDADGRPHRVERVEEEVRLEAAPEREDRKS